MMDGYISNKILEAHLVEIWSDANRLGGMRGWDMAFYQLLALRSLVARTSGIRSEKYRMVDFLVDVSIKVPVGLL